MSSVLFIYPPISFKEKSSLSAYSPPLGALYLGTVLKNKGHDVHVVDADAERLSMKQLIKRVKSLEPDVIGMTCLTFTLDSCKTIAKEIRKVTDAYLAVGGPHISVVPEASLKQLGADACVVGEAETIIEQLVNEKPRGIVYAKEIQDIDSIPLPDRSLTEHIRYGTFYGMRFGKNMTGILTTRGCKYGCTYCNRPKKLCFRARSPQSILEELKTIDKAGYDSVWLADDNFTNSPKNVIKLAKLIKREKLEFNFFGQARVDVPSRGLYKSMADMGVIGLSYGVESLKPEVIRWYNKTRYPEKWPSYVKKTLELCDEYGIVFLGSLIFGAPMETKEDMVHSVEFLHKNGADLINGNILLYLVGSAIWHQAVRDGKIKRDQYMVTAPEAGLTPYSHEELTEVCNLCTNLSKRDGWKGILRKVLKRRKFRLIFSATKEFARNYRLVRKIRREAYEYGYGKKGYTTKV